MSIWLASAGLRLSDWFERWFPDAFALAMTAVVIVFAASLAIYEVVRRMPHSVASA